jgi:hypothetical protein
MVDHIFAIDSIGRDGPFICDDEIHTSNKILTFHRKSQTIDDVGQTILSFVSTITVRGSWQPESEEIPRYLHGTLPEWNVKFIIGHNADVRQQDRTSLSGQSLEVVTVDHWGTFQTELRMKYVR